MSSCISDIENIDREFRFSFEFNIHIKYSLGVKVAVKAMQKGRI